MDLLDKGFVSLAPSDDGRNWDNMWEWIKDHHKHDVEFTNLFDKIDDEMPLPPMYLDTDELVNNRAVFEDTSLSLYENSLISVVNETTFYHGMNLNESRFLSEKIFKPIAVGHPFIFVSVPKALEALRNLGYKTFHPFIDETYDSQFDNEIRMKKILKEIERLCNMSSQEIIDFIRNVKPICEHNQLLLRSKTYPFISGQDPAHKLLHYHFIRRTL
jgi:hypothetical protein